MNPNRFLTRATLQGRRRAIVKTLCYRLFMVLITIGVAWLITGSSTDAVNIGIVANLAKTVTYYLYERAWDHITWGLDADAG